MKYARMVLSGVVALVVVCVLSGPALAATEIVDEPPANPPFYGALYVTGYSPQLGTVTIYLPSTYREGYLGVDSNGYLVNISATSITGYFAQAYNASVTLSRFALPTYRASSTTSTTTTLYLRPTASNAHIATSSTPAVSVSELLPWLNLLVLGVIFLCFLMRSRR